MRSLQDRFYSVCNNDFVIIIKFAQIYINNLLTTYKHIMLWAGLVGNNGTRMKRMSHCSNMHLSHYINLLRIDSL